MSYRVETYSLKHPEYSQDGPTCEHLSAALELMQDLMGDRSLRGIRIRDMGRDPHKRDQIIVSVENLHNRVGA